MLKVGLEPTTLVFSVLRSKPTGATWAVAIKANF